MLYIRSDANSVIGMGHVARCLSIAEASYQFEGQKPVFLTAEESGRKIIEDRGFEVRVLRTDYRDMEAELGILSGILQAGDVILVDSYHVTTEYFKKLGKLCRTAYLEDVGVSYPVDLLINYNIYAPKLERYYETAENPPKNMLLGTKYMPLRESFQRDIAYKVKEEVCDIMVTTGGSDPCFVAGAFVDEILREKGLWRNITYHIVSGPFNSFASQLKEKCAGIENLIVHENVSDMKALMKKCDVLLTAAGSTIYEACVLGIPMICFYFVENQRQGAETLACLTPIINAGNFSDNAAKVCQNMVGALKKCVDSREYREKLRESERKLVDTKGAMRVVRKLVEMQRGGK